MEFSRFVELKGGYNFRDLGGYATINNYRVKSSTVFRSAALSFLTVEDIDVIDRLGIRLVIDFRATHERECWPSRGVFPTWARDYDASNADLGRMLRNPATTVDKCRATMVRTYRDLPEEQAESYTELFHRIAAGDLPILFHCAVGTDRTGVAAALLLALLGVSRATIEEDYLLTLRVSERIASDARAAIELLGSIIEDDVLGPVFDATPEYLSAMFAEINARYGSVQDYARERLQLAGGQIKAIRSQLLIG